jgi:hypothetical protein
MPRLLALHAHMHALPAASIGIQTFGASLSIEGEAERPVARVTSLQALEMLGKAPLLLSIILWLLLLPLLLSIALGNTRRST